MDCATVAAQATNQTSFTFLIPADAVAIVIKEEGKNTAVSVGLFQSSDQQREMMMNQQKQLIVAAFLLIPVVVIIDGYSVIDIRDERVKEVAMFAANTVIDQIGNSIANNSMPSEFRIVSAASQIATGFKMELEFKPIQVLSDAVESSKTLVQQQPIKCKVIVFESANAIRKVTSCSCCKRPATASISTTTAPPLSITRPSSPSSAAVEHLPIPNANNSSMRLVSDCSFLLLLIFSHHFFH